MSCESEGESGWKFGESGTCYTGTDAKERAIAQGIAMGEIDAEKLDEAVKAAKEDRAATAAAQAEAPEGVSVVSVKLSDERREATGVLAKAFDGTSASLDVDGEALWPEDVFLLARSFMHRELIGGHDDNHDRLPHNRRLVEIFVNDDRIASPKFPPNAAVITMHYPDDEDWALVKSGQRSGFSFDAATTPDIREVEILVRPDEVVAG
ncbi:MAG: hypothetical protein ABIL09_00355 [Gemmatimonadota bacterium]